MPEFDARGQPVGTLDARHWKVLADAIRRGECTPFLGAGACVPTLPAGRELARAIADEFEYPLPDKDDLARVVQFIALTYDPKFAKQEIVNRIRKCGYPDFNGEEPHHVLASLPLAVYLTTNYDDFLGRAMAANGREYRRDFCPWRPELAATHPSVWQLEADYRPSAAKPLIYHLHGFDEVPESMVVTEDDYLEYIYNIAKSGSAAKTVDRAWELFPPPIMRAISNNCLIFLGYRLADWNFRVIFRWLVLSLHKMQTRLKVAVQLVPDHDERLQQASQEYLSRYFRDMFDAQVFWGTAQQFVAELKRNV